jgi:hypothetical protein
MSGSQLSSDVGTEPSTLVDVVTSGAASRPALTRDQGATLLDYASGDPQALWQASAATALFVAGVGAARPRAERPTPQLVTASSRMHVDVRSHA